MVEQETEQSDVDMQMVAAGNAGTNFNTQSAVKFPPGTYEIILIMDCRELHKKRDVDEMTKGLLNKGVKVEVRALQMGDVAWIARDITGKHQGEETECVLDFVVERKRMDDLVGSIRDGRYDDQKVGGPWRRHCVGVSAASC
jgi:crossover junction endonuclease MUS81